MTKVVAPQNATLSAPALSEARIRKVMGCLQSSDAVDCLVTALGWLVREDDPKTTHTRKTGDPTQRKSTCARGYLITAGPSQ